MPWLWDALRSWTTSMTPLCTTPVAIKREKRNALIVSVALVWAAVFVVAPVFAWSPKAYLSVTWLSLAALWATALATQALYLTQLYGTDVWSHPFTPRRSWATYLKPFFCWNLAYFTFFILIGSHFSLGFGVGTLWWVMEEEHTAACVMRALVISMDGAQPSYLSEASSHVQTLKNWVQRYWRRFVKSSLALGASGVMVLRVLWTLEGSWRVVIVYVSFLTVLWMSAFVRYHEILTSRFDYGPSADPKSLDRALPSIKSQDPIIKGYGLGYLRWLMQFGGALGQSSREALFRATDASTPWDICAEACISEVHSMSVCIASLLGHVPDITATTLMVTPRRARDTALKIQHKCIMGMATAATEQDHAGVARYGSHPVGALITCVFEGHAFMSYFERVTKSMTQGYTVVEIWSLKPLLLQFEMTGYALWNAYRENLFVQMAPSQLLSDSVMKGYIQHFTQQG